MIIWWNTLGPRARAAFLTGLVAILGVFSAAAWWLLRTERAVLFSDLRAQDAAVMTAELDKLKVPYALADNGTTVLVERSDVHAVRLKLMGRDLPLHGAVGLELFGHTDFGMTEFAQKINYQRALQGELTRTILSFPEIRDARVHLALPDQGMFRQNAARPKAGVTLAVRQGRSLRNEQVSGIQRLVAAAVPGLTAQEVTIVDQHGAALNRAAEGELDTGGSSGGLDLKRDTENYLSRKVGQVLEQAFGAGQALASVDVTLNMDQVRVTTEDVLPAPNFSGGAVSGVLVRERESARDSAAPDVRSNDARAARGSSMQRDVEYQVGRRIEQVVSQPGAIRRIQVVAVLRQSLPDLQKEQIQRLVAAAAGASSERGDTVVVQTLSPVEAAEATGRDAEPRSAVGQAASSTTPWIAMGLAAAMVGVLALARLRSGRNAPAVLTGTERVAALRRVEGWLLESAEGASMEANVPGSRRT